MTTIQYTTLALVAVVTSACGGVINTTDDASDESDTSATASGGGDPTDGGDKNKAMHFACYNSTNYQVNAAGGQVYFDLMHTCVALDDPDNWMSDENMVKILDACTATCQKSAGGWKNNCSNDGWASVQPTGVKCNPDDYKPEYGGDIPWLDGVQSFDRQVKCDLNTTCAAAFGATVSDRLGREDFVVDASGSSGAERHTDLALRIAHGRTDLTIGGSLEYSPTDCGWSACPWYLGALELAQVDAESAVMLDLGELGRVDMQVSDLRAQLAEPALGISLRDGQVAFPAGSLTFRVDLEIGGSASPLVEDGPQSFLVYNPDPVVGRFIDGSLELRMEIPTVFGTVHVSSISHDE
jgi:hypothetical protein